MAAANARVGVAVAAFYPDVRLSGASGFETANLGDIFAGQSLIWSIGPSITVPIFEGGRNAANLQNAHAQYEETVNRYRAQVLTAFQDVENALVDLHTLAGQSAAQDIAVTAARRALELSQQQYEKGAVAFWMSSMRSGRCYKMRGFPRNCWAQNAGHSSTDQSTWRPVGQMNF